MININFSLVHELHEGLYVSKLHIFQDYYWIILLILRENCIEVSAAR